jgi:hypothetical protein
MQTEERTPENGRPVLLTMITNGIQCIIAIANFEDHKPTDHIADGLRVAVSVSLPHPALLNVI